MKYLLVLLFSFNLAAQNCVSYLYLGDTLQYKACMKVENIDEKYSQFDMRFHQPYDSALAICPRYAYAYGEKSTAYLKTGDFITWKKLIDSAVKYDEKANLGYRAWCRYQFFRDYSGAIKDIEHLESIVNYDIGRGINDMYHLNITKGMCFSALGNKHKAIEIIEKQINSKDYDPNLYDYYQLGVTYFEVKNYKEAKICFLKQSEINPLAENEYYLAKIFKLENNREAFLQSKNRAIKFYSENKNLRDLYTHHFNKVFFEEMKIL